MTWNPLEYEYKRFKHGNTSNPLNKKGFEDYRDSDFGVPNPIIDSQFESDIGNVRTCSKCNGYNVSVDMVTNQTVCNDCKESVNPTIVDFRKKMEDAQEEEQKRILDALSRGCDYLNKTWT